MHLNNNPYAYYYGTAAYHTFRTFDFTNFNLILDLNNMNCE